MENSLESQDKFELRENSRNNTVALILDTLDVSRVVVYMQENNIYHLEINSNVFPGKNIDFIDDFYFLEGISIVGFPPIDITPLNRLSNLKSITMDTVREGKIDFGNFPKLERCYYCWGVKGADTIFNASSTLKELTIRRYKQSEKHDFSNFINLKVLELFAPNISNLNSIRMLNKLTSLYLDSCRKLVDISLLSEFVNLKRLSLEYCKKINDLTPIKKLTNLEFLDISDMADINTVSFLEEFINLDTLLIKGETKILDGNINSIANLYKKGTLKFIALRHRKFYTHKKEDFGYVRPGPSFFLKK